MGFDKETFSHRMKVARMERRMSQEDLAKASGLSVNQIARYEACYSVPGLDKVCRLADALGVTTDYLAGLSEPLIAAAERK